MYSYLFWDIDNTILDFGASEQYAIRALFAKYQLGTCSDEMLHLYSNINKKYWEALERGEMSKSEILVGRFRVFFEKIGVNPRYAEAFNLDYQEALGDHIVFIEHAKETLQEEKGKYTLVAVTNGTERAQVKKLKNSGLNTIFDAVFISENVGIEKPGVGYFEYIFRELGIVDQNQILLIGDSLTSDMQGGENAGIDTCWYNPKHAVNHSVAVTYEIDDLRKLSNILMH